MAQIVHDIPDDGPDEQPSWEIVIPGVDRLLVPGGWIYRTDRGVVSTEAGSHLVFDLLVDHAPGIRVIAERFGVNPSTVQRISRPFDGASVAVA